MRTEEPDVLPLVAARPLIRAGDALSSVAHVLVGGAAGSRRDVTVEWTAQATVGDLAGELDLGPRLCIGGRSYDPEELVDVVDLHHGVVVREVDADDTTEVDELRRGAVHPAPEPECAVVEQIAGWSAGGVAPATPGRYSLRHNGRIQAQIQLGPAAPDSHMSEPPPVDGVSRWEESSVHRVGDSAFAVHVDHEARAWMPRTMPARIARPHRIDRPPRLMPPPVPATPAEEPAPVPPVRPPRPSAVLVLAPLLLGVVMAIVLRPWFLLFALFGPVMSGGRWWEAHRSYRREVAQWEHESTAHQRHVDNQRCSHRAEVRRTHRCAHPSLGELVRWAVQSDHRLWERRPDHDDVMHLVVGWDFSASDERTGNGRGVPLALDFGAGRTVGFVGEPALVLEVVRSVVVQAVTLHGPGDLTLEAPVDEAWDWAKWLPHTVGPTTGQRATGDRTALHFALTRDTPGGPVASQTSLVLAADRTALPSECQTIIEIAETSLTVVDVSGREPDKELLPMGCSGLLADRVATSLAPLIDPEHSSGGATNRSITWEGVLSEFRSVSSPSAATGMGTLATPVGRRRSDGGLVELDLVANGPHALVAGTTGSGKSEFLRTWVLGMATMHTADVVHFVLIDFKGGGAFDGLGQLPQVAAVVTDLDPSTATRALTALRAELLSREAWLRDASLRDLGDLDRRAGVGCKVGAEQASGSVMQRHPARLVLVVDEFATVAADLPEFLDGLVDVAQRGRSLGVHLVLATQRPAGVVDRKIRANTNLRVCLRVQDELESLDIVGRPDAARLPLGSAGRAVVRFDSEDQAEVQFALVRSPSVQPAFVVRSRPFTAQVKHQPFDQDNGDDSPAAHSLGPWVDAISAAHRSQGIDSASLPWLDPVPVDRPASDLDPPAGSSAPIGWADDPAGRSQELWCWDLDSPLAVLGGSALERIEVVQLLMHAARGAGRTAALLTADPKLAERFGHWAGTIGPGDADRMFHLLDRLETASADQPVMVIVDRYELIAADADVRTTAEVRTRLDALIQSGQQSRAVAVMTPTERGLPQRLLSAIGQKLVLELPDPMGVSSLGLRVRGLPRWTHRQAVDIRTGLAVQLAKPPDLAADVLWPDALVIQQRSG